jgi:hypothetical protein
MGILLLAFSFVAAAQSLEENKIYRLSKTVNDLVLIPPADESNKFVAAKGSKFVVIDSGGSTFYVVRFVSVVDFKESKSTVVEDSEYKLSKTIGLVDISRSVERSFGGPVSGPLVVPFKYRLDDKSLSGDAAIGYYAGYGFEPKIIGTDFRIPISPFVAGGLSQISVVNNGTTDNKTGITLAVGFLIQNWANINIGLVIGQDRIGESTWAHEGGRWVSFMIGWDAK